MINDINENLVADTLANVESELSLMAHCLSSSNNFEEFRNKFVDGLLKIDLKPREPKGYAVRFRENDVLDFYRDDEGFPVEYHTLGEAEKAALDMGYEKFEVVDLEPCRS